MTLLTAVSSAASAVRERRVCIAAPPACSVMAESRCKSSCEGQRSGSSRPDHAESPDVAALSEGLQHIPCEYATSEDACNPARRQSGSAHLACGRTRSSQSRGHGDQNTRQLRARACERRASRGSAASHWALERARSISLEEADEIQKYAVERQSTVSRMRNTLPCLERHSTLYPLPRSTG